MTIFPEHRIVILAARTTGYVRGLAAALRIVRKYHGWSEAHADIQRLMDNASEQSVSPEEFPDEAAPKAKSPELVGG